MEMNDWYQTFEQLEQEMIQLTEQFVKVKESTQQKIENLEMENQHLRERLADLEDLQEQETETAQTEVLSRSRRNLEKLYEEGYHVCQANYGSRRDEDDSCLFCVDVIYNDHV